jgi:hypothetical protein
MTTMGRNLAWLKVSVTTGTRSCHARIVTGPDRYQVFHPNQCHCLHEQKYLQCNCSQSHYLECYVASTQVGCFQNIDYKLGNITFSRDPLSIVTCDSDLIHILYMANTMNITKDNVHITNFGKFQIHKEQGTNSQSNHWSDVDHRKL